MAVHVIIPCSASHLLTCILFLFSINPKEERDDTKYFNRERKDERMKPKKIYLHELSYTEAVKSGTIEYLTRLRITGMSPHIGSGIFFIHMQYSMFLLPQVVFYRITLFSSVTVTVQYYLKLIFIGSPYFQKLTLELKVVFHRITIFSKVSFISLICIS